MVTPVSMPLKEAVNTHHVDSREQVCLLIVEEGLLTDHLEAHETHHS